MDGWLGWMRIARGRGGWVCAARGAAARRPFFVRAEDGIRGADVTGVQTCALPIFVAAALFAAEALAAVAGTIVGRAAFIGRTVAVAGGTALVGGFVAKTRLAFESGLVAVGGEIGRASCRERV